jgi:hypothetical protein
MPDTERTPQKFTDPHITAKGETRASVAYTGTKTLWFNTGTLCNIECVNCYIESSPRNDRLVYLTLEDVKPYLDELEAAGEGGCEIGFTGGEPFMAPEIIPILEETLKRGFTALVLTNAMQPMMRPHIKGGLMDLNERFGDRLTLRVSLDHYTARLHDEERGMGSFGLTVMGLTWLAENKFRVDLAGRTMWDEEEPAARAGYAELIQQIGLDLDPADTTRLVLFPEMKDDGNPPEITTDCWGILDVSPDDQMCASQRMVVRRKGAERASVVACTLLPYDMQFELGNTLEESRGSVQLNHPYCASFCVLGGGSCSA